ncbi:alpha/beta fold hydrolase [Pontibacter ruber]|uniref:Alpha/beta fold hydrolase n=1 Tax=Pontibacter ruber TaxID=1343895 RepID=A0ABW5CWV7_9BACT|nr:alpha/beta hydrolase [Pontibacter ruber]
MRASLRNNLLLAFLCLLCLNAQCQTAKKAPAADPVFEGLKYKYTTKKVMLADGTSITYVDEGKGPETIIFIHGLGSYLPAWDKNIEDLSKSYRCIALDLPGYGKSAKEGVQPGMDAYATAVLALMDKLKLKQAILAGHSMGAQIALTAAMKEPQRVKKLILAAPAGFETFTEQQKQLFKATVTPESVQKTTPEQVAANIKINFYQMPADAQFMIADRLKMAESKQFGAYSAAVAGSVAAMVDEPVYEQLPQVQAPTLIVFGEHDALIPNRYLNPGLTTQAVAESGRDRIPNSQLVMVPAAGHFVQYEQPETFNKEVLSFLKQQQQSGNSNKSK